MTPGNRVAAERYWLRIALLIGAPDQSGEEFEDALNVWILGAATDDVAQRDMCPVLAMIDKELAGGRVRAIVELMRVVGWGRA